MWCHMTQEYYGLSMGISKISRYLHTSCLWALGHSYMILTFIPFNVLWHKKQEYFVIGSGVAQWFSRFFVPSSFMGIRAIPYDLDIHSIWCDMTQEKKNILGSCFNRVTWKYICWLKRKQLVLSHKMILAGCHITHIQFYKKKFNNF